MLLHYFYFFLFYFLMTCYGLVRINENGDFEVFSNLTEFEVSNNNTYNDEIINVCEEVGKKFEICWCSDSFMSCHNFKHNLNVKATRNNFAAKHIEITHSNVSTLEKGKIFATNVETIEILMIEHTVIEHIEDGAFDELSALEILQLKHNGLEMIDENVLTEKVGRKLKDFTFSFNPISSFDPSILKNLINLEKLHFSGNKKFGGKIENQFPESLSKLKILKMELCQLNYLGENVFDNLRNLEYIDLSFNNFTSIPSAIKTLSNLKTLYFGSNPIEKFEKDSFERNTNLENLFLTFCPKLKSIEDCAFCKLPNLKIIYFVSSPSLSDIHENAFGSISNNAHAPKINQFSIENCNISVLPEKLLEWENVEIIAINENPFTCNCSMAWLFHDLLSNNSIYESHLSSTYDFRRVDHKYTLGCLEPSPTTSNHTHPLTIVETFASCNSSTGNNHL